MKKPNTLNLTCGCRSCVTLLVGMTAATCVSWVFNHSVVWAIVHGLLNWLYLAYKAVWYVVTHY